MNNKFSVYVKTNKQQPKLCLCSTSGIHDYRNRNGRIDICCKGIELLNFTRPISLKWTKKITPKLLNQTMRICKASSIRSSWICFAYFSASGSKNHRIHFNSNEEINKWILLWQDTTPPYCERIYGSMPM